MKAQLQQIVSDHYRELMRRNSLYTNKQDG